MKCLVALLLLLAAASSHASSPLSGHLGLAPAPSVGGWQSVTSADQAVGLSERIFHADWNGQVLVNVSAFAGVTKPMLSAPAAPVRFLGGDVIQVPGSTLDWALGTKMGDEWLPRLKTGVLVAHDLSRLKQARLFHPDFIGVGASILWGD